MSDLEFSGLYHDGTHASVQNVTIRIESASLSIRVPGGGELASWPLRKLIRHDDGTGPMRLGLGEGEARLVTADPDFVAALCKVAPQLCKKRGLVATLRLALILGVLSAALAGGVYLGIPRAAEAIVPLIPPSAEMRIGAQSYKSLGQIWPACPLDDRVHHALSDLTARLMGKTEFPFDVTVDIVHMNIENAFTLPGGHVLFSYSLIRTMDSPDELAGVLGHELGHVLERDPMVGVIQSTGMNVLLSVLTGGGSGSGENALQTAGTLATLSYSRRLERRADEHGIAMLAQAGISPAGLADLFERLEKKEQGDALFTLPALLSTHPATPERIAMLRQAASGKTNPALSAEDWAAVKSACEPKDEKKDEKKSDKPAKKPSRKSN